jgi:hypothetical protein
MNNKIDSGQLDILENAKVLKSAMNQAFRKLERML